MTKKLLITGLHSDTSEEGIQSWLDRFGPVVQVDIIREGNAAKPFALVEMDIGEGAAAYLASRLSNSCHEGAIISVSLLHH